MTDTKIISIPEGNGGGSVPAWLPFMNNNGGGILSGNGLGGGILGFLIGMLFPRLFGNRGGLLGNNDGDGAGTAYLGNMISNDNGRELLMQAITSQGEQSRQAIQTLSTMLGQDFNLVNSNVQTIAQSINQIANAQGVNALQIVNAIQAGNASISAQFSQCCCQNQLALAEQTNALQRAIDSVGQQVAAKSAADQLATCQQTYALTDTMNRNYQLLDNKIDALESGRKDREITALTAKVAQLESQNFTTGVIAQAMGPVQAQLAGIRSEVDGLKCKLPETITLPNSQYAVVPTWAANIGSDFVASYWANRLSAATAAATTPATGGGAAA